MARYTYLDRWIMFGALWGCSQQELGNFPFSFGEELATTPVSAYLAGGKEIPGSWGKHNKPSLPGIGSYIERGTRTGTVIESTPRTMGKEAGPS